MNCHVSQRCKSSLMGAETEVEQRRMPREVRSAIAATQTAAQILSKELLIFEQTLI